MPQAAKAEELPTPPPAAAKSQTEKITTPYPVELIERARNAAYWDRTTLAGIMVQALADALDRMEQGRGEPYAPRASQLRGGRPVGTGKSK
jgi:ribosome-binding protein aMBF1 (putative translation factor)